MGIGGWHASNLLDEVTSVWKPETAFNNCACCCCCCGGGGGGGGGGFLEKKLRWLIYYNNPSIVRISCETNFFGKTGSTASNSCFKEIDSTTNNFLL